MDLIDYASPDITCQDPGPTKTAYFAACGAGVQSQVLPQAPCTSVSTLEVGEVGRGVI